MDNNCFSGQDYPEYFPLVERLFLPLRVKSRIAVQCDAQTIPVFKIVSGKRLAFRSIAGVRDEIPVAIGRATNGDIMPAGEKFCEILRKGSNVSNPRSTKTAAVRPL